MSEYKAAVIASLNGFKKIKEDGCTFVTNTFWNPRTHEVKTICVRDYDYQDCCRDIDELYNMPIDEEAKINYLHSIGEILPGDTVMVIKGRKIPCGSVKKVRSKYPFKDRYGRWQADYLYFDDGTKTNVENCILVVNT